MFQSNATRLPRSGVRNAGRLRLLPVITLLVLAGCQNPFNQDETPTGNGSGTATGSVTVSLNVSTDAEGNSIVPDVRSMVAE